MFIIGLGTATPPRKFGQAELWAGCQAAAPFVGLSDRSRALLRKVLLGDNGIETRALALDSVTEAFQLTPDVLHERFLRHAPALALEAARRALAEAALMPEQMDAVIISTCTGYLCPGLTSYVAEQLGLRPNVFALDLVGLGCAAAVPNLRLAEALLAGGRAAHVLSISVEVCSAAFYLDDDPGVLISACLFGDGAGAAVLARAPRAGVRRVEWQAAGSTLDPTHRDALRFEQRGGLLRNILTPPVPGLAAAASADVLARVLAAAGRPQRDITGWIWHAGGRDVLRALREQLNLDENDTRLSAAVLREYGNQSSACVFHVLQRALQEGGPGGWWWLSAFGAGFVCHGALLRVD